jgi:hypothetical protein
MYSGVATPLSFMRREDTGMDLDDYFVCMLRLSKVGSVSG